MCWTPEPLVDLRTLESQKLLGKLLDISDSYNNAILSEPQSPCKMEV